MTTERDAAALIAYCLKHNIKLTTAESCTGGLLSSFLTEIPGVSNVFEYGFVTYSDQAKVDMLGVDADLIKNHGAVSEEVAESMARGAFQKAQADIAVAITGIAGPSGGTKEKPVGLVFIAVATHNDCIAYRHQFKGERNGIRLQSARVALERMEAATRLLFS
jgi:nicotinamide-nucleotide amidase